MDDLFSFFWEVLGKTQQETTEFLISNEEEERFHKDGAHEAAGAGDPLETDAQEAGHREQKPRSGLAARRTPKAFRNPSSKQMT